MNAQCIMVCSGKGGTGKSTVSVLLGACLARLGRKTLLVELDSGLRSVDIIAGVYGRTVYDIEDVLCGRCEGAKAVVPSPLYPGLSVISAPYEGGAVEAAPLGRLLTAMRPYFDFILLDTAAGMGAPFTAASTVADKALLVLTPDPVALRDGKIVADRLLAGGWVDVFETPGKTTGAYATGIYGVHPYMLLNFTGELGDVFTLAHEAGHCLHTFYSDSQPYMLKDYPIFLAEIASTVNENILLRGMLAGCDASTEEGRREKAVLANRYLEEFRGTVYRQTMFAEFELKVHEMAEKGEPLTAESFCQVYHGLLRDYFGPDVGIDPYMDWEWARIPHFYNAFYVYKYATGFSAAAAITRRILCGEGLEDYLAFLHAGGSDYPAETLKRAGVDMSTPQPVEAALQEFADMAAELEKLLG